MKIKLSKSQWGKIGTKAGWVKKSEDLTKNTQVKNMIAQSFSIEDGGLIIYTEDGKIKINSRDIVKIMSLFPNIGTREIGLASLTVAFIILSEQNPQLLKTRLNAMISAL